MTLPKMHATKKDFAQTAVDLLQGQIISYGTLSWQEVNPIKLVYEQDGWLNFNSQHL